MMGTLVDIVKNNPKYAKSEVVGFISAYGSATLTMYALSHTDTSPEAKAVVTLLAKDLGFIAGKLLSHQSDFSQILKSGVSTNIVKGVCQLFGHYFVLKNRLVPEYMSHFVGYGIPGVIGTSLRYLYDYKAKLITINKKR